CAPPAWAKRVVDAEVKLDGMVVLTAGGGDDGKPGHDVWGYLKRYEFRPAERFSVTPETKDPLKAVLRGEIVVQIDYGGEARTTSLKLVRPRKDAPFWKIAPGEVERLRKIAG